MTEITTYLLIYLCVLAIVVAVEVLIFFVALFFGRKLFPTGYPFKVDMRNMFKEVAPYMGTGIAFFTALYWLACGVGIFF